MKISVYGSPNFGQQVEARLNEPVSALTLHLEIPELPAGCRWVPYLGTAIIDHVSIEIDRHPIEMTGEMLHILHHLEPRNIAQYHKLIGHDPEMFKSWCKKNRTLLIVPLKFDIQKIAGRYNQNLRVTINLTPSDKLIQVKDNGHPPNVPLHEVYLMGSTKPYEGTQVTTELVYQHVVRDWGLKKYLNYKCQQRALKLVCTEGRRYLPLHIQNI